MATGREHLDSIISRAGEMQNWTDEELDLNKDNLRHADDDLDDTGNQADIDRENALIRKLKPKPPKAEYF